jgi:hypothetical protein
MLRSRLVRRGLAMSAALIAAAFARTASACPPGDLIASTASAGNLLLRGVPLEQLVSSQTAALVVEVAAGFASLGKLSAAVFLASGSVVLAVAVTVWQVQADIGPRSLGAMFRPAAVESCGCAGDPALVAAPCPPDTATATIAAASASIAGPSAHP